MSVFDPVWDALTPHEQARIVQLLVERVDYDGRTCSVSITFHAAGIKTLADEVASKQQEKSA
jgi:site-specific DNA recombinase